MKRPSGCTMRPMSMNRTSESTSAAGRVLGRAGDVQLVRPEVRRTARKDAQRHVAPGQHVGDVAKGPIPAGADDEPGTRIQRLLDLPAHAELAAAVRHVHVPSRRRGGREARGAPGTGRGTTTGCR